MPATTDDGVFILIDMKTNVILESVDRDLFGITIRQNTKDGQMLSVSDLQTSYNKARFMYGWSVRRIDNIIATKSFQERLYYTLKELDLIKTSNLGFMEMIEREGVTNVMKGLGVWKTKGKGENKSVYCNPYIWVSLALEMNPMIYAKVVIWLTDKLIINRIEAGSSYSPMNKAINSIIDEPEYWKFAKAINENVFGFHEKDIRNKASQEQLERVAYIERFITTSIEMGMVKNEEQIIYVIKNCK